MGGPPPYPILEYAEFGNLRAFLRFQRNIGQVNHKLELVCVTLKFIIEKDFIQMTHTVTHKL